LDQLGQREVYMRNNYDSLAEKSLHNFMGKAVESEAGKSISAKFFSSPVVQNEKSSEYSITTSRRSMKNAEAIEQVLEPQRAAMKKRLELRKQIEESRKKLDSVSKFQFSNMMINYYHY
jgi:hypothetical protein